MAKHRTRKHLVAVFSLLLVGGISYVATRKEPNEGSLAQTIGQEKHPVLPRASANRTLAGPGLPPSGSGPTRKTATVEETDSQAPSSSRLSRDPFQEAPVLLIEETVIDSEGTLQRVRVVKTSMKYPLVRVEEKLRRDAETGEDEILSRVAMAADHLVLRLEQGYTDEDLRAAVGTATGFDLRRPRPTSKILLLTFDGTKDIHALEKALAQVRALPMVRTPEPDYIVRAN